jgi:hypothetical protein
MEWYFLLMRGCAQFRPSIRAQVSPGIRVEKRGARAAVPVPRIHEESFMTSGSTRVLDVGAPALSRRTREGADVAPEPLGSEGAPRPTARGVAKGLWALGGTR